MAYRSATTYKEKSHAAEPRFLANMRERAITRRRLTTTPIRTRDYSRSYEMED